MKAEHQLQIAAVKGERIFFKDYGLYIFLSDGHIGVYLKEKELKIDRSKMTEIINQDGFISFDPEELSKERTNAAETKNAIKSYSGFAIQIKSTENETQCYAQEKYLKMFAGYTGLKIKDSKSPILVLKYGCPYGIIMPVYAPVKEGE